MKKPTIKWLSKIPAKPIDYTHPNANMYGVFPCPYCFSQYRWPNQQGKVICDDCGLTQELELVTQPKPTK